MTGRLSQTDTTDGYTSLCYVVRNFLAPIVPLHRQLELEKQELAKRPDFTLTAAFQRFTASVHAKLSEQDVYFGFQLLGVQCDLADARLFVDRYDQDGDLRVSYFEFQNVLLPQ